MDKTGKADTAGRSRSEESGTQCIHRSLGILRLLAGGASQGLKLVDIAAAMSLSHPTAHRILKALEEEGIVERVNGSRRYTIGNEAAWLGLAAADRFPITTVAAPVLDGLSQSVGDSVFLAVPSRSDSVYADRRIGAYPVQATTLAVGTRRALGVSVAGRTMMGFMNDRKIDALLCENERSYESYRLTPNSILDGIREVRGRGYLCADSVTAREKRVVAVPIFNMVGMPVAAISVIAPGYRLPAARIPRLVPMLRSAAQEISRGLADRVRVA
jgi:DNA-binding IclR family transcriptional regulator